MKIFPVIHIKDYDTALQQAMIALYFGADGIFFISHHGDDALVVRTARGINEILKDEDRKRFQVGINLLSSDPESAAALAQEHSFDMVWADYMGVDSSGYTTVGAELSGFAKRNAHIGMFASVAFKYQPHEPDPARAAMLAKTMGFIPTTSGSATGSAPELEKIITMSRATDGLLAVASGMVPENVAEYAPYLSHILVSTGISADDYHLDQRKLLTLMERAREHGRP